MVKPIDIVEEHRQKNVSSGRGGLGGMPPEEIIKVFTKYDLIFHTIHVPVFRGIVTITPIDEIDLTAEPVILAICDYRIVSIEEGLEGVKFVHYREV